MGLFSDVQIHLWYVNNVRIFLNYVCDMQNRSHVYWGGRVSSFRSFYDVCPICKNFLVQCITIFTVIPNNIWQATKLEIKIYFMSILNKWILNPILALDKYGIALTLSYNGKNVYKTQLGSLLTII